MHALDIETSGDAVETQNRHGAMLRRDPLLPWSPPSIRRLSLADAELDIVAGDDGFLGKGTKS